MLLLSSLLRKLHLHRYKKYVEVALQITATTTQQQYSLPPNLGRSSNSNYYYYYSTQREYDDGNSCEMKSITNMNDCCIRNNSIGHSMSFVNLLMDHDASNTAPNVTISTQTYDYAQENHLELGVPKSPLIANDTDINSNIIHSNNNNSSRRQHQHENNPSMVKTAIQQQENEQYAVPQKYTLYRYRSNPKVETYFQWDYRNYNKLHGSLSLKRNHTRYRHNICLLDKIERTIQNAVYEPYSPYRGVATVRKNIIQCHYTQESFRLGPNKSLTTNQMIHKSKFVDYSSINEYVFKRMKRILRPIYLRDCIYTILHERHAIYASHGTTYDITKVHSKLLGQSFLGHTTQIQIDAETTKNILRELWMYGYSRKFNELQNQHSSSNSSVKQKKK